MLSLSYKDKIQLLRELVEALMWELDAIRSGQWDRIPQFTQNKQALTDRMAEFDWTPAADDKDQLEYLSLKGQIIDLEYQVRQSLEVKMETVKLQMTDLHQRHNRWKAAITPLSAKIKIKNINKGIGGLFMIYQKVVKPLLFRWDPETVHHLTIALLQNPLFSALATVGCSYENPSLRRTVFGIDFPNPVGLAAGFDKNALLLPVWEKFGFGHVEIGTVTLHGQEGNPRPRVFRVPEVEAVINRMGFPNEGAELIAQRLESYKRSGNWPKIPVGINIGKSKVTPLEEAPNDYWATFQRLESYADYVAINVSSPNTPGLRSLQTKESLSRILEPIQGSNRRKIPILVKISPDLSWEEVEAVLETIDQFKCAGIIAANTTLDKSSVTLKEEGGLSGPPVRVKSTEIIRAISKKRDRQLPIIGVGGIQHPEEAKEKLNAGASLVQLYTGFIYQGPQSVKRILEEI